MPVPGCYDAQVEIDWAMRGLLVEILIEIHHEFRLQEATLFLAVNILDRYCSRQPIKGDELLLVGCVALFVAAKFRETQDRQPALGSFVSACEEHYSIEDFTTLEGKLLHALDWTVDHPDVCTFICTTLAGTPSAARLEHLSIFIAETMLFQRQYMETRPSHIAQSARALAEYIVEYVSPSSVSPKILDRQEFSHIYNLLAKPREVLIHKYASSNMSKAYLKAVMCLCLVKVDSMLYMCL